MDLKFSERDIDLRTRQCIFGLNPARRLLDRSTRWGSEDGKNRQRTSLPMRPDIFVEREGNAGCDIATILGQ